MKQRILFVCLGNICRSPAAEAMLRVLVEREGLGDRVEIDSAGTYGGHSGERSDPRMRRAMLQMKCRVFISRLQQADLMKVSFTRSIIRRQDSMRMHFR